MTKKGSRHADKAPSIADVSVAGLSGYDVSLAGLSGYDVSLRFGHQRSTYAKFQLLVYQVMMCRRVARNKIANFIRFQLLVYQVMMCRKTLASWTRKYCVSVAGLSGYDVSRALSRPLAVKSAVSVAGLSGYDVSRRSDKTRDVLETVSVAGLSGYDVSRITTATKTLCMRFQLLVYQVMMCRASHLRRNRPFQSFSCWFIRL